MNFKKIIFSLVLFVSFTFAAVANSPLIEVEKTPQSFEIVIKKLIQDVDFDLKDLNHTTVNISFLVNNENELIVLSTDDKSIDATLKSTLNYKKVNSKELKRNTVYVIPIRFELRK